MELLLLLMVLLVLLTLLDRQWSAETTYAWRKDRVLAAGDHWGQFTNQARRLR